MRTMADTEAEVERLEERLRTAMESGLVAELEALLDDRAVFIDADRLRYDKQGVFKGAAFAGRHRYLRAWSKTETGWRIIAASVCAWPRPQDETDG